MSLFNNTSSTNQFDEHYIHQLFDYYQTRFHQSKAELEHLYSLPQIPKDLFNHHKIGLCDRTLSKFYPNNRSFSSSAFRGSLQRSGLIKPSGHELFRGCLVFPEVNKRNKYVSAVGIRVAKRIRKWQSRVINWKRPNEDEYYQEILCSVQMMIDAKTR